MKQFNTLFLFTMLFVCYVPNIVYAENIYLLAMNANVAKLIKHTDRDRKRIISSFKSVYGTERLTVYPIPNVTRGKYN